MAARRIVCQCGGRLPDPVPATCPHCGAPIVAVRRSRTRQIGTLLIVIAMFATLALFTWWMATSGS